MNYGCPARSATSPALAWAISWRAAGSTAGYPGLMAVSACTTTAAVARRVNHLWSARTTYQGAHCLLVQLSVLSNARSYSSQCQPTRTSLDQKLLFLLR